MKTNIIYFFGLILILSSCYPEGPEYYEDLDVVYTNYNNEFIFQEQSTYSMPDKIVKLTGKIADDGLPEFVKEPYNTMMINVIEDNMKALGYEKTEEPRDADVVLFPAVWTNTTIYYWYDYWCWYYPYYCGWGWGYPTASSYTTGTLLMTLFAEGEEYIDPLLTWTAAANGLVSGAYDIDRVTNAIDKAFEQSPYLKTN